MALGYPSSFSRHVEVTKNQRRNVPKVSTRTAHRFSPGARNWGTEGTDK